MFKLFLLVLLVKTVNYLVFFDLFFVLVTEAQRLSLTFLIVIPAFAGMTILGQTPVFVPS